MNTVSRLDMESCFANKNTDQINLVLIPRELSAAVLKEVGEVII